MSDIFFLDFKGRIKSRKTVFVFQCKKIPVSVSFCMTEGMFPEVQKGEFTYLPPAFFVCRQSQRVDVEIYVCAVLPGYFCGCLLQYRAHARHRCRALYLEHYLAYEE